MSTKVPSRLSKKNHYLQVALNSTLEDAWSIITTLPQTEHILIEAGTPLIKKYGMRAVSDLISAGESRGIINPYIIADMKTIDRGASEVAMVAEAGASGIVAMGSAPIETLNVFIESCHSYGIDPMIDMMNVEFPLNILRSLKQQPRVTILHRGVDEERDNKQKMLPLYEIRRIKGAYDMLIAVAGGDTVREVQSAVFNDADIVIVWKSVYNNTSTTKEIIDEFLKKVR